MQRGNGFKKKDITHLIGQQFGLLRITGSSTQPGRIACRCECGTECEPIMNMVLNQRTKSCGYLRAEKFKSDWDRKAKKLPLAVRRSIFNRLAAGYYDVAI